MKKEYQLPKEFAEKWVAALRSGEHEQVQVTLECGGGYCALGLALIANNIPIKNNHGRNNYPALEEIMEAELIKLIYRLNDSGSSFSEIADWIERNVEFI